MAQAIYTLAILGAGTILGAALVACYYAGKAAGYKAGEKKGFLEGMGTSMKAFDAAIADMAAKRKND